MNTKAFIVLIMIVIVLGGSIGGAFAGGDFATQETERNGFQV